MNHYYGNGNNIYRQRVVEAVRWTPGDTPAANALASWLQRNNAVWTTVGIGEKCVIRLHATPDGAPGWDAGGDGDSALPMTVLDGDWIVKDPLGAFSVVDAAVFEAAFEKVESER